MIKLAEFSIDHTQVWEHLIFTAYNMTMAGDRSEARRTYIQEEVKGNAQVVLSFLVENSLSLPVKSDDLRQATFYLNEREIKIEEALDAYTIGRNIGRLILAYVNPKLASSLTMRAEKVRRVVYHLFGILNVRINDEEADIDSFPDKYPTANDGEMPFTLKETRAEKMDRLTGKPIDVPDGISCEDESGEKREFFREEEKHLPQKDDFPEDPEVEEGLAEFERRKEDGRYDPHQETDFGFNFDVSDLGHKGDKVDRIREEVDSVFFDRQDERRQKRMSEEFRAARTIFLGRRDSTENWQRVLQNLLTSDEDASITYLKGIYNY